MMNKKMIVDGLAYLVFTTVTLATIFGMVLYITGPAWFTF